MGKLSLIDRLLGFRLSKDGYKYKINNNYLVPKVKGYKLEDLFVAKLIKVTNINDEYLEENKEFDYNLLSGNKVPPITEDDYDVDVMDEFMILRPSLFRGEEKDYYDIFTGYGYNEFDFTAEKNEEYVDSIISFQTYFKEFITKSKIKIFPMIATKDIITIKNITHKCIADLKQAEKQGIVTNLDQFMDNCQNFMMLYSVWKILKRHQDKSAHKDNSENLK
ncbi:MAG: hypothetical protein ACLRFL_03735 [Clostridia bacterium]